MMVDSRITSIDVLRGLVVLLLVPNIPGGWSMRDMAGRFPDDPVWSALGAQFTHVAWVGASLWDLVMPAFVFVAGAAMAISTTRRIDAGETNGRLLAKAALRSISLIVLGAAIALDRSASVWLELLPYTVVAAGLPWSRWFNRWTGSASLRRTDWLDLGLPALAAGVTGSLTALRMVWTGVYDFGSILLLLGLAYLPSYVLMRCGPRVALGGAVAILVLYAAAFSVHRPAGAASAWEQGANAADVFDLWLQNAMPRSEPYLGGPPGFHTLQFVPTVVSMWVGAVVGDMLTRAGEDRVGLAVRLALASIAGFAVAATIAALGVPLVKSIWTPTWVLFGSSVCTFTLAVLVIAFDRPSGRRLALPLVVLGENALLLYVISYIHRWRIVLPVEHLLGTAVTASPMRPVLDSLIVLVALWVLAAWLHRKRIRVSL